MAQFSFNVRDNDRVIRDPSVYHFPTAQVARDAAVQMMRALIREHDDAFDGKDLEIRDVTGHPVAVVHVYDVMPIRYH
jgi:hypothetical protein